MTRLELVDYYECPNPKKVDNFLSNDYPQLQSLVLDISHKEPIIFVMIDFLKRHPNLVELELCKSYIYDLSSIGECSTLRKLSIRDRGNCNILPISQLNNLTSLKISTGFGGQSLVEVLETSKSVHSIEELVIAGEFYGTNLLTALKRFTNLKYLSVSLQIRVKQDFADFNLLEKMRLRKLNEFLPSISSDGLVDLVRHLTHLEVLSIHTCSFFSERIELKESTYLRICDVCRSQNQKLMISDNDSFDDGREKRKGKKWFYGDDREEFVQLDYRDSSKHIFYI